MQPDVYGYGFVTSDSIMSYNPALYTDGFVPRQRAGELIPEDRRALAENKQWCKNGEHGGSREPYHNLEAFAVSITPRQADSNGRTGGIQP